MDSFYTFIVLSICSYIIRETAKFVLLWLQIPFLSYEGRR